ncbi:hypothetical protein LMG28688_05803 [Paraburkholderia caffeinitolerans]|uniref:Uncharacterized protein n=1 Tax=Paraburkholderia caffeinitolerans TaxID=1723730 RepID=A0A6J5GQI1_9BURK|nr:hypothetical protein [Paraburkholderia caffeinitolerans]CAB3803498.1 hypothetical protein LMG28688_05803 [Paraburkholderia caffeinitolerans]
MTRITMLMAAAMLGIAATVPQVGNAGTAKPARHLIECGNDQQKVYVAYAFSDARRSGTGSVTTCMANGDVTTEAGIWKLEDSLSARFQRKVVILNMIRLDR